MTTDYIPFNATGNELVYAAEAQRNHHLSGDGPFTKRCHQWIEQQTGCARALYIGTRSWLRCYWTTRPATKLFCLPIRSLRPRTHSCCAARYRCSSTSRTHALGQIMLEGWQITGGSTGVTGF